MSQTFIPSSYSGIGSELHGLAADGDLYSGIGEDHYDGLFSTIKDKWEEVKDNSRERRENRQERRGDRRDRRKSRRFSRRGRRYDRRSRRRSRRGGFLSKLGFGDLGMVPYGAYGYDSEYGGWLKEVFSRVTRVRESLKENRAQTLQDKYKRKCTGSKKSKAGGFTCRSLERRIGRKVGKVEKFEGKIAARGHTTKVGLTSSGKIESKSKVSRMRDSSKVRKRKDIRARRKERFAALKAAAPVEAAALAESWAASAEDPLLAEHGEMVYAEDYGEEPSSLPLILGGVLILALGGGIIYTMKSKKK